MYSKLLAWGGATLLGASLFLAPAMAQESKADQQADNQANQMAQQNAKQEPHMSAALEHLRQAQEELEKATPNKGGHRDKAMDLTRQAQSQVEQGIQYYQQHDVGKPMSNKKK